MWKGLATNVYDIKWLVVLQIASYNYVDSSNNFK